MLTPKLLTCLSLSPHWLCWAWCKLLCSCVRSWLLDLGHLGKENRNCSPFGRGFQAEQFPSPVLAVFPLVSARRGQQGHHTGQGTLHQGVAAQLRPSSAQTPGPDLGRQKCCQSLLILWTKGYPSFPRELGHHAAFPGLGRARQRDAHGEPCHGVPVEEGWAWASS